MGLNILMLTDNDPAGMGIAFCQAINRHTVHRCRLVTTATKYAMGYPADIHLPEIADDDFGEVEALLRQADVIHFHVLFNEDRMLGPFLVREFVAGKKLVNHHHGHPDFLANHERYRDRYRELGRTVLVSTPDLLRLLPEATWIPNLVPIHDPLFLPRADDHLARQDEVRLVQAPTRKWNKHTREFRAVCQRLAARHPEVSTHVLEGLSYAECLRAKRSGHACFDHMNGHFGISSLESLAQGVPVIAGLDSLNVESIQAFTGESSLPWVIARTESELEARLEELVVSPELRVETGRRSREFMERCWTEQHVLRALLPIYES